MSQQWMTASADKTLSVFQKLLQQITNYNFYLCGTQWTVKKTLQHNTYNKSEQTEVNQTKLANNCLSYGLISFSFFYNYCLQKLMKCLRNNGQIWTHEKKLSLHYCGRSLPTFLNNIHQHIWCYMRTASHAPLPWEQKISEKRICSTL
jgi:hypothetical protein